MKKAILFGWLCINIPITAILLSLGYLAFSLGYGFRIGILLACIPAWLYWSFTIPLWRRWALSQACDPEELDKYGQLFLLTFRKGSFLARTEYKYKDKGN